MLSWVIILLVPPLTVLLALFFRRVSALSAVFLALFLWLALLALFGKTAHFTITSRERPKAAFLLDVSRSVQADFQAIEKLNSRDTPVYYFSGSLSDRKSLLEQGETAVIDSILTARKLLGDNTRLIVVSDFNDNASMNTFTRQDNVIPVVTPPSGQNAGSPVLLTIESPETIESEEPFQWYARIYSPKTAKASIILKNKSQIVQSVAVTLKPGINWVTNQSTLTGKGIQDLTFSIGKSSSLRRLIYSVSQLYRLALIAGRPSEELAFLRRLLSKLKWIGIEANILLKPGDFAVIPKQDEYQGLIIMDITDKQIKNPLSLNVFKKPVLFIPGLHGQDETAQIWSSFTGNIPQDDLGERRISYNGQDLVVQSAYYLQAPTLDISEIRKVVLIWDTWKWDFSALTGPFTANNHEVFWQNCLNFILSGNQTPPLPRLNYITGEDNPAQAKTPGLYSYQSNGTEMKALIQDNPAETGQIGPDRDAAAILDKNILSFETIKDWSVLAAKARGNETILKKTPVTFDFRTNAVSLALMLLFLLLSWILRDVKKIYE